MDDVTRLTELLDQSPGMGGSAGVAVRLLDAGLRFTDRETCQHVVRSDEGTAYCGLGAEYTQRLTDELREAKAELEVAHRRLEVAGRAMPFPAFLDEWFRAKGPCLLCGTPGALQRHRILDTVRERVEAGEEVESVADDYDLPEWVVGRVAAEWTGDEPV